MAATMICNVNHNGKSFSAGDACPPEHEALFLEKGFAEKAKAAELAPAAEQAAEPKKKRAK